MPLRDFLYYLQSVLEIVHGINIPYSTLQEKLIKYTFDYPANPRDLNSADIDGVGEYLEEKLENYTKAEVYEFFTCDCFRWSESPQGYSYWSNVRNYMAEDSKNYIIPKYKPQNLKKWKFTKKKKG